MATKNVIEGASSPENAYKYAREVIKGLWPTLGEAGIAQDARYAYCYAANVIGRRFELGEPAIAQDAGCAYLYAREVIKDRWPLGEAAIAQDSRWAYYYACELVEGRFPEGEDAIAQDAYWASSYYNHFKDQFTERERLIWLLKQ